jgi:hypothetical protein
MMLLEISYILVRIIASLLKIITFLIKHTKSDRSTPKD